MTYSLRGVCFLAVAVAIGLLVGPHHAEAVKTQGKSRPALTKYLMAGIVQPNCAGAGKAVKESGPADDKAWDVLACQASCLNELSFVLMDDGRCPDGVWAGAAKSLREGSAALLDAAGKKDLSAAQAAMKTVGGSCGACHKAHKPPKT